MSIASLSRFTVPLASDQSASSQGLLMPKLKYRFRVTFENFGVSGSTTELTKQVASAARPTATFTNNIIEVYNSKINYAGKVSWEALAVKLRDDVNGNVSKLVGEQMQRQFDFFEQSSSAAAGDYKFTLRIEMLDGGNGNNAATVLETWECYGCYIEKATYGNMAYSEQTPIEIDLSIRPDNCMQTPQGTGIGAVVARKTGTQAIGS
jgi:hypothetical protein